LHSNYKEFIIYVNTALCFVRSEVLTAVLLKIQVFWDVMLCHWIFGTCCLSGTCDLHMQSQALKEEEEGHSFTFQKIRIFYIMFVGLWLVVFICTVTCHIYILINQKPRSAGTLPIYQWSTTCTNCDIMYFSYCRLCVLQVRLVGREQAE